MLMRLYLDEDFKPEYADLVAGVTSEEYYVNMMIAWYMATALAKQWMRLFPMWKSTGFQTGFIGKQSKKQSKVTG